MIGGRMLDRLLHRIKRKLVKLRLLPIRVYCLHHVSVEYDADTMNRGDWMQIEEFKNKVRTLRTEGMKFISMTEAYHHICNDWVRCKKYAVLTFDDGYASLNEILPWLEEQRIPATLFINGKYLDGKSFRNNSKEKYLTMGELKTLTSPLIEIGNHGWEHVRVTDMMEEEFEKAVEQSVNILSGHPNYVQFWAYTYGDHSNMTDEYLHGLFIVPVYIDGLKNYNESNLIHREML